MTASPLNDCTPPKTAGPHPPGPRLIDRRRCLRTLEDERCITECDTVAVGGLAAAPERPLVHQQGILVPFAKAAFCAAVPRKAATARRVCPSSADWCRASPQAQ